MDLFVLWVTIATGLIGYFITYIYNLSLARRADHLKYVNAQMDELYGPLYIITQTGRILFQALRKKRLERRGDEDDTNPAKTAQADREWRIWVQAVFQPLNEQLEQVIINKAHLVIEEDMPQSLKHFLAHSAGYKAVIAEWDEGNYDEASSIIKYPNDLVQYAKDSFKSLRREQLRLIGHKNKNTKLPIEEENELEITGT